jgi:dTDP-glucose 4,6-dehydratase
LVTGGAGFIGANFVHHWLKQHSDGRLVVLDALTYAGNLASLDAVRDHACFRFVHGKIEDTGLVEALLRDEQLDTVVHFAAESHVDRSISGPDAFVQTNVVGTHSLLKAARKVWLDERKLQQHRFHHVSTDEVYGSLGPSDPAFTERTPYSPNSPYSASKAASDHLARAYHHTYGLDVTISNCSNNYGPYHFPEKLIPLIAVNILEGRPLPVYGDGMNVRDWLHVADHCAAIDLILREGRAGETYNIGGGEESTNIGLVRRLCGLVSEMFAADPSLCRRFPASPCAQGRDAATLISYVADRPGHDRRYAIDCSKLRRELGFATQGSLEQGLRSTLAWFVANESWWRAIMDHRYRQYIEAHYQSGSQLTRATGVPLDGK